MAACVVESSVHFQILPLSEDVKAMYSSHGAYHAGDSGLDLFVVADQTIAAGATASIKLGVNIAAWAAMSTEVDVTSDKAKNTSEKTSEETSSASDTASNEASKPSSTTNRKNSSFMMMPRSSIYKTPLRLCNSVGLVDAGYRGELMVVVDNIKTEEYTVKKGDRLVQIVGFTGGDVSFEIVEALNATSRGSGGFGSTGSALKQDDANSNGKRQSSGSSDQPQENAPPEQSTKGDFSDATEPNKRVKTLEDVQQDTTV
mmetsp:Transcript_590/g.662  ORF Transcript_590/g.662 Transcript_590/m.662 type:complete len:258 (-) Transcript_590:168-941(-)